MKTLSALALVLLLSGVGSAQAGKQPASVKELADRIKRLEAELEAAKQEMAQAEKQLTGTHRPARIHAANMKVGQVAVFHWSSQSTRLIGGGSGRVVRVMDRPRDETLMVRVIEIIDKETKLVKIIDSQIAHPPEFIIKGESTDGLVTGKTFEMTSSYKVERTQKFGQETVFVLSPAVSSQTPADSKRVAARIEGRATDPNDNRRFWRFSPQHGGGYFKLQGNGTWEEIGKTGERIALWKEIGRAPEYVELYDATRNYKTRLGKGKAWMASGRDSTELNPSPEGNWAHQD